MGLLQGMMGNYNEIPVEQLMSNYGGFLATNEKFTLGLQLIRDMVLFTDRRIIFLDKQGMTGSKKRVDSVYLNSIVDVTLETPGVGLDDSELTFTYIITPYQRAHNVQYATKTLEFAKKFNVLGLYRYFLDLVFHNRSRINGF